MCKAEDVKEGEMKVFSIDQKELLVIHTTSAFYCVENICPHRNAPLSEGILEGSVLTCPFHAAQFELSSNKVSFGVPIPPLKTFKVELEENKVFVLM